MLACTEMITMCLQSAKQKHLRAQQQQQPLHTAGQGLTIFHDIFRRADKNDDGKLSFEEFNAYFADGILTTEELQELFYSIDGRQNNNLDTDKLSDYFSQHLGEYLNVLSALESLNIAILKAMDKTKEEYQGSSVLGQFVTRFMLRETSSQLQSLQRSLQCAMEAVEEQSSPAPREVKAPELTAVQRNGRRCGRRVHNNMCVSPPDLCSGILTTNVNVEDGENWCSQINRLQQLLDKLECQLPEIPRKTYTMKSPSSCEVVQSVYEDPDASLPGVAAESQSELKVKPVPRPRIKSLPKIECNNNNNNNNADSVDTTNNATNAENSQRHGYPAHFKKPQPVRPAPKPPASKCVTSGEPTVEVKGGDHHLKPNTDTIIQPPAVRTERVYTPLPTRPQRPPPPSIYYDRFGSTTRPRYENCISESQQSRCSSISPVSSVLSDEVLSPHWSNDSTAPDFTEKPAIPPRQSVYSHSAPKCETLPPQTRPPLPKFSPPPPPSSGPSMESLYTEIDFPSYLDILPEDEDSMTQGSTLHLGQHWQSSRCSSHQQTTMDTEDINGMLRWLKRVSKSDVMAPSLYGLSFEEEMRTFNERAMNVKKALRLYNLLMMKRNENLKNLITEFKAISKILDKTQKTNKTMGIAGGTTGAVGGVTAVLGIALAPMTMGASLIATAVGAGMVATAGGMGAHAAKSNKKVVNRMAVEKLAYDYKENVVDLEHCLDFILSGMNELRRHDIARLQRAGAPTDALKMAHLSQSVMRDYNERKASVAHTTGMSSERLLQAFIKEIDQYFTEKEGQKLKKSNKGRFSGRVRLLAENLQDELDRLNRLWELFT